MLFKLVGYARDTELRGPVMSSLEILAMVRGRIEAIVKQRGYGHNRLCNLSPDELRL
jgi:hypothetical protein